MSLVSRGVTVVLLGVLGLLLPMGNPSGAYPRPGLNYLASTSAMTGNAAQTGDSHAPAISADARFVAFHSSASDLIPGDVNASNDVFLWDRDTRKILLVSRTINGTPVLGDSRYPSVSANGRYIAFESTAPNIVPGDTDICLPQSSWRCADVFVFDRISASITQESVPSHPAPVGGEVEGAWLPHLSTTGRFVAFTSDKSGLTSDDTGGQPSVFVRDRKTGRTVLASVDNEGVPMRSRGNIAISGDGTRVVFGQDAPVTGAGNLFLRDLRTGRTTQIDVANDGTPGSGALPGGGGSHLSDNQPSGSSAISRNGRFVIFESSHTNLVPNDTNNSGWAGTDTFIHDTKTGRTTRVSVTSRGGESALNGYWRGASISPDGRYITFNTLAHLDDRLSPDPTFNPTPWICPPTTFGTSDCGSFVYVHDVETGATQLVSVDGEGGPPGACPRWASGGSIALEPSISAGGRFIAYSSCNQGVVQGGDSEAGMYQIYVRDNGPNLGVGELIASAQSPGVARGEANHSASAALFRVHGTELYDASVVSRPGYDDLLVRIELRSMPSVRGLPARSEPGLLYGLRFSADGGEYEIRVQRVPDSDYDPAGGASFGLYRKDAATGLYTTHVATLRGGYGTTGEEIVVAVPLDSIGSSSEELSRFEAFTAFGSYRSGSVRRLDSLSLVLVME